MALCAAGTAAQTKITPYNPGITAEGITYYLPRTELRIRVTATCVKYTPGDFRAYSERFLRLNNIPKEASSTWKIDNVKIFTEGVPDEKKIFSIKLSQKTSAPLATLTQSGILVSVNAQTTPPAAIPEMPKPI